MDKNKLIEHEESHDMEEEICNRCGCKSMDKNELIEHKESYDAVEEKNCNHCGYKSMSRDNMREHRKIHSASQGEARGVQRSGLGWAECGGSVKASYNIL